MKFQAVNKIFIVAALIVIMVWAYSCTVSQPATDPNDVSYIYNPVNKPLNHRYTVFNEPGNKSILSVKLFSDDLLFSEANVTGEPLASLTITVRLFNDNQGGVLTDTAKLTLEINKKNVGSEFVIPIELEAFDGFEYTAELRLMENTTRRMAQSFIKFDRSSPYSSNYYRAKHHGINDELFTNVLIKNEFVNLQYPSGQPDSLYILYYKYFDLVPYPPSMMLPERSVDRDPAMIIPIAWSDTLPIMFPGKGIYLCSVDSNIRQGYTFFNFGEEFPELTTPETMIEPLAYIATQDEMIAMRSSQRPKLALDEFWLARGTNIERSRELLRIYFKRVLFANFYFTSYKEGWRTDRGMIYIIYGPPDKIYKNSEGERWGYNKPVVKSKWGSGYSVEEEYLWFLFTYKKNPFTTNDYYLNRSDATPTFWEQAVASWRNGVAFSVSSPDDIR